MLKEFRSIDVYWDKATRRIYEEIRSSSSDEKGRKMTVQIVNDGQIQDLTNVALNLYWETQDGENRGLDPFEPLDAENGIYELYFRTGMLQHVGKLNAHLHLVDTTGAITSEPFTIVVFEGVDVDAMASDDELSALNQALIEVQNIKQAEVERVANEEQRTIAEEERIENEQVRATNEGERVNAESTRTNAETNRASAETSRVNAEQARATAETERVTAESARVSAEEERAEGYPLLDGRLTTVEQDIIDIQAFVGYTDDDIMGVEVDFKNKKFTRLAGAVNKTPGEMFDDVQAFGGRKRCILTDDGVVLAYHGEPGYTETGALTQSITLGEGEDAVTYNSGTLVQVMVEQPKFYYKVVPLQLDKVVDGKGFHMRKARYYVSDVKKTGFKLHPAFIHKGKEKNFIYLSAYEGSLYDVSASAYILDDAQIGSFVATTGDKLSSIANAKPASGLTQDLTRAKTRIIARNRGTGWEQAYASTVSATQLLFAIEYASFNTQSKIGNGVQKVDDGATNMAEPTGATTLLGNTSGAAANGSVTYRGEENFWGNIWKWVDGLNIEAKGLHNLYVANENFADDIGTDPYKDAGITLAKSNGYISAFAYNEEFDWLFFPSETLGNSSLPIGDNFWQNYEYNGWLVARLGGSWGIGSAAGGFCWFVYAFSLRNRTVGGRLVYVPDAA